MDQGRQINLDVQRVLSARHLGNKLWNAAKFVGARGTDHALLADEAGCLPEDLKLADRWILSRLATAAAECDVHLEAFQLGAAATVAREALVADFCDVYVEISKQFP